MKVTAHSVTSNTSTETAKQRFRVKTSRGGVGVKGNMEKGMNGTVFKK